MNRDFLKEAIADAKTVKESAIANAKAALEEAFSPQLKSMLASKLEEMDKYEEDDVKEEVELAEEEVTEETIEETISEEMDEEMDLDEILNELEKDEMKESESSLEEELTEAEEDEAEEADEETEEVEAEEDEEEIDLEDMSEEDLKAFIEDVIEDMVAAGELEAGEAMEDEGVEDEMEMDLDVEMDSEEEVVAEEKDDYMEEMKKELEEAYATIESLNSELNEINLLNSKLLYSNKIFKSKSLTEAQKAKVLGAFDKATTVKEVKLVFETLNSDIKTKKTKQISENMIGSASKATITPKVTKKPIVESNEMVARFQKLAGINKK
jgi:hypothetical protein